MKATPDMTVKELLKSHPQVKKVLEKRGMMCPGCKGIEHETVRNAARSHGVPLQTFLQEINQNIKPSK